MACCIYDMNIDMYFWYHISTYVVSSQQDCNSTSDTEAQSQPNLARIDTVSNIVHKSTKLQNSSK